MEGKNEMEEIFVKNFLSMFDEGIFGHFDNFEILTQILKLSQDFRNILNLKTKKKYSELEDLFKEYVIQRDRDLVKQVYRFLTQRIYFD